MEEIVFEDHLFKIPSGLSKDFNILLEIISPSTWNDVLTDEHRTHLMTLLPDFPEDDLGEKTQSLEMFFMAENFYFGSPLFTFFKKLKSGYFKSNVTKLRKISKKLMHKSCRYHLKNYYHQTLEEILMSQKKFLTSGAVPDIFFSQQLNSRLDRREVCVQRAKKRYFKELKLMKSELNCGSDSSDENYPEGPGIVLNKKQRRQLFLAESVFPSHLNLIRGTHSRGSLALDLEARITSLENPFDSSDEHLRNLLSSHIAKRKRKSVSCDKGGITLEGVFERTYGDCMKRSIQRLSSSRSLYSKVKKKQKRQGSVEEESSERTVYKNVRSMSTGLPYVKEVFSDESSSELESDGRITFKEESLTNEDLMSETHLSFFSLLRDIICSASDQRMGRQQLERSIKSWQASAVSALNKWFCLSDSWLQLLPSAINFLCGNFSMDLPCDFVPFIEYKNSFKCFQWIGAGRDTDSNLGKLSQFWLVRSEVIGSDWPSSSSNHNSVEGTVKTGSTCWYPDLESGMNPYHSQEKSRYENPHKAFTYRMNGYESVIGPVKGVYFQQSGSTSKARDHTMLLPGRPPYVTILSLVWDAVARLPNGEGTKSDICKLVKDSQFIVPITSPNMEMSLINVVSGALDRLQNEKDPCIKFDTSRKLWVYLHSNRTEEEFERMHHLNGPVSGNKKMNSSKKPKIKKEDSKKGPPNVTMEQFSTAIKQMDGSEVQVKEEDLLKNLIKFSPAAEKKSFNRSVTQAKTVAALNIKTEPELSDGSFENKPVKVAVTDTLSQESHSVSFGKLQELKGETPSRTASEPLPLSKDNTKVLKTKKLCFTAANPSASPLKPTTIIKSTRHYQSAAEKKKQALSATLAESNSLPTSVAPKSPAIVPVAAKVPAVISTTSNPQVVKSSTPVTAIKLLQYSPHNLIGKAGGNAAVMMDVSNAVPASLLGQKLVLAGNKVFIHGGKIAQNVTGMEGEKCKQVFAGIVPAHQIMALNNVRKSADDHISLERGGRFIHISPVNNSSGLTTQLQKIAILPHFGQISVPLAAKNATEGQETGNCINGIRTVSGGELKLKLERASGSMAGGFLGLGGGKQIFLTTKAPSTTNKPQFHEVVVDDAGSSRINNITAVKEAIGTTQHIFIPQSGEKAATFVSSSPQHIVVPVSSNQLLLPSDTNSGQLVLSPNSKGQFNLKPFQAIQSFKFLPASPLSSKQKGKTVVAHILPQSTSIGASTVSLQIDSKNAKEAKK